MNFFTNKKADFLLKSLDFCKQTKDILDFKHAFSTNHFDIISINDFINKIERYSPVELKTTISSILNTTNFDIIAKLMTGLETLNSHILNEINSIY